MSFKLPDCLSGWRPERKEEEEGNMSMGKMMKQVGRQVQKKKKKKEFAIKKVSECVCVYTFVYRGTRHVIETQCRVHVVHILQKREKILHFFKRDTLINTTK